MDLILNHYLFGPVKVIHAVIAAGAVIAVLWLYPMIFKNRSRADVYETVRCLECGWAGQVSKYHRTCRKCNGTTLEKIS